MLIRFFLFSLMLISGLVVAAPDEALIRPIQDQWAEIKYRVPEKQQAERYQALAVQARQLVDAHPKQAEPLIWEGIALSSEAGARGGLGALSLAEAAKDRLEAALRLDDHALAGSAYTSLGTLLHKVPGWPISFGDKKRAETLLKKALTLNPGGIDPNFFYGEYLFDRGRHEEAITHLETALKAPARPGRKVADTGRRQEVQVMIDKVRREMKN